VAVACGFKSQQHFARVFRRVRSQSYRLKVLLRALAVFRGQVS
jgi:transcriptional regulator GlxA family with amidase domain